jgi:YggT family protein
MFVLSNFVEALAGVLNMLLTVYMWIIIARAVISWVSPDPYNPIVRFLYSATEPVLYRLRRVLPLYTGGMDLSPILVLIIIFFLQQFLVQSLYDLARSMRYTG